jgi:hypothetical membrane protein
VLECVVIRILLRNHLWFRLESDRVDGPSLAPRGSAAGVAPAGRRSSVGGILWIVGSIQFFLAMIITQLAWTTPYSLANNDISDLGEVHCSFDFGEGVYVCSPWHSVFNVSVILLGILVIAGVVAVLPAFSSRISARAGLGLFGLLGIGAILVGAFPADVTPGVHILGSLFAFIGGGVAMILLSGAGSVPLRWRSYRPYSLASGIVALVAFVIFLASPTYGPLGSGGVERVIVAPILLWLVVTGLLLTRLPKESVPSTTDDEAAMGSSTPAAGTP